MKLFITGGAGFIGSNFILHWLKQHPDDSIVNFDLLTYAGNLANLSSVQDNPNYRFVKGDIRDLSAVLEAAKGCEVFVHFAAESHVDRSIMNPSEFVTTNVVGTQILLEAARQLQIKKFHHISTDEVFGSLTLESSEKFSEKTPYNPHSPYSASKAGSDHLVRAYHDTFGLPITITNCTNNYGPYQFPEKFIPLAITNILEGKHIPVYTPGNQVRDWLFVEDHCSAIERVLTKGDDGETYCVGGLTKDVTNLEVVKMILSLMGKDESWIDMVKDRPGHDVRYALDWTHIHQTLDWQPSVSFEGGLGKTITWYTEHQDWWKPLKQGNYQKYYTQQYGKMNEEAA